VQKEASTFLVLKVSKQHLYNLAVLQDDWSNLAAYTAKGMNKDFSSYLELDLAEDAEAFTLAEVQPHILQAKLCISDPDNPTYNQAMASPDSDCWWDAMITEMETLENKLKAWELVPYGSSMNSILPSTWAFKLKRYPDGTVKKFKAHFCVRGDCQIEGVDFWETWAHVVQWSTVRTMMVLSTKLGLKSAQADIAPVPSCMPIWVKMSISMCGSLVE
jgi:hypothetical protein